MPRFLHTADWQIGRQYGSLPPDNAVPLAQARYAAVERLAQLATAQQVDAVLVAGDVFDAQTVSDRCIRQLFNALAAHAGPWILLPGNHDAALTESVWTRALRLAAVPPNVHLALSPQRLDFADRGFVVLPAPLTQRHTYSDLTAWFDTAETEPGRVRIGLAHGSVQGVLAEQIDSANPIAPDRPERARLDYLAMGDWHGCKAIQPRLWYSGTPETDRFKANDSGRALLVDVAHAGAEPQVTVLETGQFRWTSLEATLQVASDLDGLLDRLAALTARDVVDLSVSGPIDLAGHQRLQAALGRAEAQARHLAADLGGLRLDPTDEDLAGLHADGYLGEVIDELRETRRAGGEAAGVAQDALMLLTAALAARQGTADAPALPAGAAA